MLTKLDSLAAYRQFAERADRIIDARIGRARVACRRAGLDSFGVLHNALVSLHYGKPWVEVDYQAAKRADYLYRNAFSSVSNIRASAWTKVCRRVYGYKGD